MKKASLIGFVVVFLAGMAYGSTSFAQSFVPWGAYGEANAYGGGYQTHAPIHVPFNGTWSYGYRSDDRNGYRYEHRHVELDSNGHQSSYSYSRSVSGHVNKNEQNQPVVHGKSYEKLSENAQDLYDQLYRTMAYGSEIGADAISRVSYDTLDLVFVALLDDHPEFKKFVEDVDDEKTDLDEIYNDEELADDNHELTDGMDECPYIAEEESNSSVIVDKGVKSAPSYKVDDFSVPTVYSLLTSEDKKIYDSIYPAVRDAKDSIVLSGSYSIQEIKPALRAMLQDHPEFVWLDDDYEITDYGNSTTLNLNYNQFASDPSKYQKEFEEAASVLVENAKKLKTPAEMEKYFYEQIKFNVQYVSSDYDQSAYAALILHQSVCKGAAMAMKYLLNQVGIPSFVVTSRSHAWNMVKIDGKWHYTDATPYNRVISRENALKNQKYYKKLNVSKSKFSETPDWDEFPNSILPEVL